MVSTERLGQGWALPLRPEDASRRLPWAGGVDKVLQSICIILDTEPGERIMRPSFGCGLRRYLMQPNTAATRALIQREVKSAIRRFEPRVTVATVNVTAGDDPALVLVAIEYTHNRDGSPGSLVYPFYLDQQ